MLFISIVRTRSKYCLATYRCLSQCHELRLSSFSSTVPDTARLDLILIVAAFFLIASLQVLILLNKVRDKSLSLPIRLAKSLEALKVACGRRVAILAVHRCRYFCESFPVPFNVVRDVGQASSSRLWMAEVKTSPWENLKPEGKRLSLAFV